MSSRQVRKLLGVPSLPPAEGSDEEFEPLFVSKKSTTSAFGSLVISSDSEAENNQNNESDENQQANETKSAEKTKNKKKKKKKQRKNKPDELNKPDEGKEVDESLDDIDKAVLEVNSLYGELPETPSTSDPEVQKYDPFKVFKELFTVQAKHLNYQNEDRRCYQLELPEEMKFRKPSHDGPKYRRAVIVPLEEGLYASKVGLSMMVLRKERGVTYFAYNHSRDYQIMHKQYLEIYKSQPILPLDMLQADMNLEGLLTFTDYLIQADKYAAASSVLKIIISNLQYYSHHSFVFTDLDNRLLYEYAENRIFHITVLKYMYVLSNKALHRTALELCKLLLNLDPINPLGVVMIIDTIAIRAKEYKWLMDAVQFWSTKADFFYNLKFTYALAQYHITRKSKSEDYSHADRLIQSAMVHHPFVAAKLLKEVCYVIEPRLANHDLFRASSPVHYKVTDMMNIAMNFQVRMIFAKFREPPVAKWFIRNANEIANKYDADEACRQEVLSFAKHRANYYTTCPDYVLRHLYVVQSMTKYLCDWEMPSLPPAQPWNPIPPVDGINRYGYGLEEQRRRHAAATGPISYSRIVRDFVYSMAPHYNPDAPAPPNGEE